jgi:hypothetical protein
MEMMMEYSKIGMEGERNSKGRPTYFMKTDALATYGVGFGHSIYGWNQNFIELPIAQVPPQISF